MSRPINGKIVVTGELVARTGISVGGAAARGPVDIEVALDGRGRPYVPGTSLTGPIRAWLSAAVDPKLSDAMLGYQAGEAGHASYLYIEDAPVSTGGARRTRTGVQIDRARGTAREQFLYTREVLPRGTRFPLRLELDLPTNEVNGHDAADFEKALRLLLERMTKGGLRVGAAKTRGCGRLTLEHLDVHAYRWGGANIEALRHWLSGAPEKIETSELGEGSKLETKAGDELVLELSWEPVDPIMVKASRDGLLADMMPLVEDIEPNEVAPLLPGSAIKGALRSHAARIVRSLMKEQPAPPGGGDPDPDGALPLVRDLFGEAGRAGRLHVDDVYQGDNRSDREKWGREDRDTLDAATVHEDHVAIDRFTGGAADGALYSVRRPKNTTGWDPVRLELDFALEPTGGGSLDPSDRGAGLVLLLLVLRDLADGWIPLGFGTRRGMGTIKVNKVAVSGQVDGLANDDVLEWLGGKGALPEDLGKAWKTALERDLRLTPRTTAEPEETRVE